MFYKFSLVYGQAWDGRMPTDMDREAMISIWMNALKNYKPETIIRAVDESLKICRYPDLPKVCELADNFAQTARCREPQIEYRPNDYERTEMPQELRDFCKKL